MAINNQPTIQTRTVTGIFTKYIAKTLPLAFDESMSYYECLCALLEYLNQTIVPDINNVNEGLEELQTFYLQLQDYVNNYFDNLDVQDEINNKLDDMVEAGTLDEIINQNIFKKVLNNPEILFGMSFKASGLGTPSETDYIISLDGINFSTINIPNMYLRDPSICYDSERKKFYFTCTPPTTTEYTFKIYETEDLINFTEHEIVIENYLTNPKYAPDLYYDEENDKLYVSFSYKYGTETDINGDTIDAFDIIICETENFNNFTMTNVHKANLINPTHRNHIDSNIIYYNNTYYLMAKDEYAKIIEIYQSLDLTNFTILCDNVLNPNNPSDNTIWLEGGCQYLFNNEYRFVADSYAHLHNIITGITNDFENINLNTTNLFRFRHSSIITINDDNARRIISALPNYNIATSNRLTESTKYRTAIYINRGDNKEFTAIPDSIFFIVGNSTITDLKNPFNCENQKFCCITNPNEKLTIQKINGESKTKVILNTSYNNEKIYTLSFNNNSNIFPNTNFEELKEFTSSEMRNLITNLDSRFTINDIVGHQSGNVFQFYLELKATENVSGQISPLFNFTTYSPRAKIRITNNVGSNIVMYSNGVVTCWNISIAQNNIVELSATYICK